MTTFAPATRVTLLHNIPHHTAGEHGTVENHHHHWVGVRFDTTPHQIRYIEPVDLAPATHDVEDVTRAAEAAVLHIIESAYADTPACTWPNCDTTAAWWWEHTCGNTIYRCHPHRTEQQQRMDDYDAAHPDRQRWNCRACHTEAPNPIPWKALR